MTGCFVTARDGIHWVTPRARPFELGTRVIIWEDRTDWAELVGAWDVQIRARRALGRIFGQFSHLVERTEPGRLPQRPGSTHSSTTRRLADG
jgi:hypothetical protein